MKTRFSFFQSSLITFVTRALVTVLGLILSVLIARLLGPEGKGLFSLFLTTAIFLRLFSKMGIDQANVYHSGLKRFDKRNIGGTSMIFGIIFSLIITGIFCLYTVFFHKMFFPVESLIIFMLIPVVVSQSINLFGRFIFLSNDKIIFFNFFSITIAVFPVLFIFFSSIFSNITINFTIVLFSIGLFLDAIFVFVFIIKEKLINFTLNFKILKELFKYGYKANIGNIFKNTLLYANIYLIAFLLNPTQVGFYSVAWGLVNKINQIPESIGTILFQRVANEKSEMIRDFIIRVYKSTIYILSLISIFLFIFIKPLINFLFPGFEQAITPAKILIPGIVMFGLYIVLSGVFLGRGKVNFYLLNTSIMALLNIFLNVILIPKFGIKGAAVASTTSLTISNLTGLIYFSKLFKVKIHQMIFPNNDDFKELYNNWLQILKVKKRFLYTNNIK